MKPKRLVHESVFRGAVVHPCDALYECIVWDDPPIDWWLRGGWRAPDCRICGVPCICEHIESK